MEFHSSKLSDSKLWVEYNSRGISYLKEVQENCKPKVPIKFVNVELCADSVLPN